ncbi:MAG: glycosyltransferase [Candidatus Thiodiazotropha sp. (ex Epidulcina cf. delphinae)]|nr:glycosyltransferase [Candidatus Thiodiazotropha sp. (ex Epidulcina cf. delphinae)]
MFSIIMPLYNKCREVEESVRSVLRQTVTNFELLIIDDGSTDASSEIVAAIHDSRIRLIRQGNVGVSAARNRGIREARYDHLAFIDADDLWAPFFLQKIKSLIQKYPQAGAYATAYLFQDGNKQQPARIFGLKDKPMLITDYFAVASRGDLPLMPSCTCIPRNILCQVGLFMEDQKQGEDQDLWSRIGLHYSIALDPSCCMYYMQAASNRVSLQSIPQMELAYSRRLQQQLNENRIPAGKRASVARYIAGHLLHLIQLNVKAGRPQLARSLLADRRTRQIPLRWIKWWLVSYLLKTRKRKNTKIIHLLNDTDMGGIKSVIDSLSQSVLAKKFEFEFDYVKPESWLRRPYQADVIIQHYASNWRTLPGMLLLRLLNPLVSIIIQEHHYTAAYEQSVPSVARFRLMLRLNYWLASQVVAVSHGQGAWLADAGIVPGDKLQVIPQSRRLDPFLQVKQKPLTERIILGAYGRFHSQKGFDLLLEAVSKLPESKFHLLLAGDGVDKAQLQAIGEKMDQVTFCGPIDDVPGFLSHCDMILIPSRFEPFGLVCLEAKAAARPVLVSDVDGLPEQARGCGMTVPQGDPQALYQALLSLPRMPLRQWGENGRRMAATAWDKYIQRWRRLLVEVA